MNSTDAVKDSPVFTVVKKGHVLEMPRDPHPEASQYTAIETPGMLVLFVKEDDVLLSGGEVKDEEEFSDENPDRDAHLRRAFTALGSRVKSSTWTSSSKPYSEMIAAFRDIYLQDDVRADVSAYLASNPSVGSAVEMLFTSIAMSARADWRAAPASMRGVAARGWFLGRWIPTFLVLDGPIMRFLTSEAFRRQAEPSEFFRAVRSFFSNRDFMSLRHGFAHWSFSWEVAGGDSVIVALGRNQGEQVQVLRAEADAFHIITFALVEAVHDVFIGGAKP
jgi:hypothetical protein